MTASLYAFLCGIHSGFAWTSLGQDWDNGEHDSQIGRIVHMSTIIWLFQFELLQMRGKISTVK